MQINSRRTMFVRYLFLAAALLLFAASPLAAQQYCDLYLQMDYSWNNSSAAVDVAAEGMCDNPQTWAYAKVTLPSGAFRDASGSGTYYAEAFASIAINGETGIGSFFGSGEAVGECSEDTYDSLSDSFRLNDPTPSITGISPGSWNAGTSTAVHITGTNFGSCPSLSITDPSNATTFSVTSSSNTSIDANVNIAASAPDETATVTVTSHGYNCQGFVSNQGSSPATPSVSVSVSPIPAPVPQICFDNCGTNIANTTQSFLVGQRVALATSVSLPPGLAVFTHSWTVPGLPSSAVAGLFGYTPGSPASGGVNQLLTFINPSITFYWVTPGNSRQVTYTYCLVNGQCNSASVTFNVSGPSSFSASTTLGSWQIVGSTSKRLQFGDLNGIPGISFETNASFAPGSPVWVQLINNFQAMNIFSGSQTTCGPYSGLDEQYPYPGGTFTNDTPSVPLPSAASSVEATYSFTMYLLWDPGLANSIPVPLGYVNWNASGKADQVSGVWSVDSSQSSRNAGSFVAASTYPSWSNVVIGSNVTCQ